MIPYEMQNLTLMQMEIFFRCAELKNFTKAARELRITTSMVSKKIGAMETELGFSLFSREKNRVALTAQGEALYAAWRNPVKTMVREAQNIRQRTFQNRSVSFSIWESTNAERFFVPLISAFSAEEDLMFRIRKHDGFDGIQELIAGKTDIAFIPKFAERGIRHMEELAYFLALPSPLYVALSARHPLYEKKILRVKDLYYVELLTAEDGVVWYTEMIQELCRDNGFDAKFISVTDDLFKTFYLCTDDKRVLITDKYYHAFSSNAVEYRELVDTESGLLMVYRKDAPDHVKHFIDFARRFYRELR